MHHLLHNVIMHELAISSLCWPLILLHHVPNRFLFVLHHVSSISAGFQLIFSLPNEWAWPCFGLPLPLSNPSLQTGSRKSWIQATAHISGGQNYCTFGSHRINSRLLVFYPFFNCNGSITVTSHHYFECNEMVTSYHKK
jgi:hypothetical protein